MTKSAMQLDETWDNERASIIATKIAIEDLALKRSTSLRNAEQLLAKGMAVEKEDRPTRTPDGRTSPDEIEVDNWSNNEHRSPTEFDEESMDVDVEELDPYPTVKPKELYFQSAPSSPSSQPSGWNSTYVFPTQTKTTNGVAPFPRHSYTRQRFSSYTWPYFVTYPNRNGTVARGYPFVYSIAGSPPMPYIPFELPRNGYRWATSVKSRNAETSRTFDERSRVLVSPEKQSKSSRCPEKRLQTFTPPRMFTPPIERSRTFQAQDETVPDELPRMFTPPPWEEKFMSEQRPRSYTPPDKSTEQVGASKLKPRRHSHDVTSNNMKTNAHVSEFDGRKTYESHKFFSPETMTGHPRESMLKRRRFSDDGLTNSTRPSVLVMRRSLSNPIANSELYNEHCTCNDDHTTDHTTDSDSSGTPPLAQAESSSSGDLTLEEKPHKCRVCGRAFRKHSALVIHHRVHSGEKPYRCPECSKDFSISGNLRRHFLIHTGERPYVCPECSRAFNNPSHLTRHRRKLHCTKPTVERSESGTSR